MSTPTKPRPKGKPHVSDAFNVQVPAGAYYVGDPCYAFDGEQWDALLESNDVFDTPVGTLVVPHPTKPGKTRTVHVVAFGTMHGDGLYSDDKGREYGVDAGLIGLVPAWFAAANAERLPADATFVVFHKATDCTAEGGLLTFGNIAIHTDPAYDAEDETPTCEVCGYHLDNLDRCPQRCEDDDENQNDEDDD